MSGHRVGGLGCTALWKAEQGSHREAEAREAPDVADSLPKVMNVNICGQWGTV